MNPKVLIFDIETTPFEVFTFGLRDQYITLEQIKKDWSVLSWAAKWLGAPASEVIYRDTRGQKDPRDDRRILKLMWELLDEADIVITQNGAKFDGPKLNARFIELGMSPPSPYEHWDTLKVARKVAAFSSNKLEYLTDKLCTKYKKLKHHSFPGLSLWKGCLANNAAAWDEMRRYNIHDVLSTEELYTKLRAWAPETAPHVHHAANNGMKCKTCGDVSVEKSGTRRKRDGLYQRYHCRSCGTWATGGKIK